MSFAFGSIGRNSENAGPPSITLAEAHQMTIEQLDAFHAAGGYIEPDLTMAVASRGALIRAGRHAVAELAAVTDVTVSFGAQAGVDTRAGVFTVGGEVNLFAIEVGLGNGYPVSLNQEISITAGAPIIGEGSLGFGRSGNGALYGPLRNRSSYRGFSRNDQGEFVVGGGAAFGVGVNAEINLTRLRNRYSRD